jgi:hypothetical protein
LLGKWFYNALPDGMSDLDTRQSGRRVGQVARSMLNGSMHYLIGALELEQLRHEVGAYENDPDFIVFIAIKMDVSSLPNSEYLLANYSNLNGIDASDLEASLIWAKSISSQQCKILAERYPEV